MSFLIALALTARIIPGTPPVVELTNSGSQPITAWSFAVVSPNAQGGTHRETHTADVYLAKVTRDLPRAPQHLDWLDPGTSVRVPVDAAPAGASVEIVAVVFADRSSDGDAATVQSFFDHRRTERDQLRAVTQAFDEVLRTAHGAAALLALESKLSGGDDSVPRRTARDAVAAYLAQAQNSNDDSLDQQLRQYATFVKKQYELAATHAEPAR